MANDNSLCDYFRTVTQALEAETLSLIDFDELSHRLAQAQQLIAAATPQIEGLEALRRDYIDRISGMAKAIAASEPRKDMSEEILSLCTSLETASAQELLTYYRRVSAKFRDAFPASFGLLRVTSGVTKKQRYSEYK